MIKLIAIFLFWSYAAVAGLPPTTTQGSAGGGYKTTFQFNFPYIPITQSGTNASFGQIPLASGVSGNLPLANMASIGTMTILSNITGGSAVPAANSLSAIIDAVLCSAQGSILYRGASSWACLAPGTNGTYLQTQGASANPQWTAGAGSATVNTFSASIAAKSGGSCAVSNELGPAGTTNWINGNANSPNTAICEITFQSGFSGTPNCMCNSVLGANYCSIDNISTTGVRLRTWTDNSAPQDSATQLFCHGPGTF